MTLQEIATLLGLSVGVQKWVRVGGRDLPLKTSPSGGARHPVEAYVVSRRVQRASRRASITTMRAGMPWSASAAAPDAERIEALHAEQRSLSRRRPRSCSSPLFSSGSSGGIPYSRAYRAALIEAGHVAQTFCLAATSLDLAPFSLMGLADPVIERDLGLDGISGAGALRRGRRQAPSRGSTGPPVHGAPSPSGPTDASTEEPP